jgi:hypothetical protein
MDQMAKNVLKNVVGISDDDMAKVPRNIEKIFANAPKSMGYKLIAEVTSSKYCFAQIKVGDKIVFDPFLNAKESTCPLCPRALIPLLISVQQAWERSLEFFSRNINDIDELNDTLFAGIAGCLDPGLEGGGIGHVNFKLYSEKK